MLISTWLPKNLRQKCYDLILQEFCYLSWKKLYYQIICNNIHFIVITFLRKHFLNSKFVLSETMKLSFVTMRRVAIIFFWIVSCKIFHAKILIPRYFMIISLLKNCTSCNILVLIEKMVAFEPKKF